VTIAGQRRITPRLSNLSGSGEDVIPRNREGSAGESERLAAAPAIPERSRGGVAED